MLMMHIHNDVNSHSFYIQLFKVVKYGNDDVSRIIIKDSYVIKTIIDNWGRKICTAFVVIEVIIDETDLLW